MSEFVFDIKKPSLKDKIVNNLSSDVLFSAIGAIAVFSIFAVASTNLENNPTSDTSIASNGPTTITECSTYDTNLVNSDALRQRCEATAGITQYYFNESICPVGTTKHFPTVKYIPVDASTGTPEAEKSTTLVPDLAVATTYEVEFELPRAVTSLKLWENSSTRHSQNSGVDNTSKDARRFTEENAKLFYQNSNGAYQPAEGIILGRSRYQEISGFPASRKFKIETDHGSGYWYQKDGEIDLWDIDGVLACLPDPTCSITSPTKPIITSPENKTEFEENSFPLFWSQNGAWGEGCPTVRTYDILIQENCSGAFTFYKRDLSNNVNSTDINALEWGKKYCVKVRKNNGGASTDSDVLEVSVRKPPTRTVYNHGTDICGNKAIGRPNVAGITNPINFNVRYRNTNPDDTIRFVGIAVVPNTNTPKIDQTVVESTVVNNKSIAIRADLITQKVQMLSPDRSWKNVGELTLGSNQKNPIGSGNATLLKENNRPVAQILENGVASANFKIEFSNTFPSGNYGIYTYGVTQDSIGRLISSAASPTFALGYEHADNWLIDMTLPSVQMPDPTYQSKSQFSMSYNASDSVSNITHIYGYLFSDIANAELRDLSTGNVLTPPANKIEYPEDQPNLDFSASSDARSYEIISPDDEPSYVFSIFATDSACNYNEGSSIAAVPAPWHFINGSTVAANEGIRNNKIPTLDVNLSEIGYSGEAYFATDEVQSGNFSIPKNQVSKEEKITQNYQDSAVEPSIIFTHRDWYSHLKQRMQNNFDGYEPNNITNISGNISDVFGVSGGTKIVRELPGNLRIESGTRCNVKGMIFVEGNLTIVPDFVNAANWAGCTFVVKGNITIENGVQKSTSQMGVGSGRSEYDRVDAFLIANGTFTTKIDNGAGINAYWDGLIIDGGVVAGETKLNRDLNFEGNTKQPAHIFNFDPRHKAMFAKELSSTRYSIREVGI